jgi:hypothetical protein
MLHACLTIIIAYNVSLAGGAVTRKLQAVPLLFVVVDMGPEFPRHNYVFIDFQKVVLDLKELSYYKQDILRLLQIRGSG